jgi:hypothetical protein
VNDFNGMTTKSAVAKKDIAVKRAVVGSRAYGLGFRAAKDLFLLLSFGVSGSDADPGNVYIKGLG